jgi:hypothetical protein
VSTPQRSRVFSIHLCRRCPPNISSVTTHRGRANRATPTTASRSSESALHRASSRGGSRLGDHASVVVFQSSGSLPDRRLGRSSRGPPSTAETIPLILWPQCPQRWAAADRHRNPDHRTVVRQRALDDQVTFTKSGLCDLRVTDTRGGARLRHTESSRKNPGPTRTRESSPQFSSGRRQRTPGVGPEEPVPPRFHDVAVRSSATAIQRPAHA